MGKDKYPRDMVDRMLADPEYYRLFFGIINHSHNGNGKVFTLKKCSNGDWKTLCPLHNERTPSFRIDAKTNRYKCFGCGRSGKITTLVQQVQRVSFFESIEYLLQLRPMVYCINDPNQLSLF